SRRTILEVDREARNAREALARRNHLDVCDRLYIDRHIRPQVAAEGDEDLLERGGREAPAAHDPERDMTRPRLHDLVPRDGVRKLLQVVREERSREVPPIGADDDRLHATLDFADRRQPATA